MQKKSDRKQSERGRRSKPLTPSESKLRPAGEGGPRQNAGGPEHRGLKGNEDRNP
jgi:hypothetical protein